MQKHTRSVLASIAICVLIISALISKWAAPSKCGAVRATNSSPQCWLEDPRYQKALWRTANTNWPAFTYDGQPLSKLLRNPNSSAPGELTLDQMLTLKEVQTRERAEIVTFQLPINYDVVTNIGKLELSIDDPEGLSMDVPLQSLARQTNGDCLLTWNTAYESRGLHAIQPVLWAARAIYDTVEIRGPVEPYLCTNLCRLFPFGSMFDDRGAQLDAYIYGTNAEFKVEILTTNRVHVKTIAGTNYTDRLQLDWDLLDDSGRKYTNDCFVVLFQIDFSNPPRSQTVVKHFYKKRSQ